MVLLLFLAVLSAQAQNTELLILLKGASALAFYTPQGKEIARTSVRLHPHEMVFSPDGRYLYTTDNGTMRIEQEGTGGNFVSIIDVKARKKTGEINLGKFRRPHGIDIDRATGRIAVTTELPDRLLLIDPKTRKIEREYPTGGKTAHMVTLGPGARFAYVSHSNSGNVTAIDLASGAITSLATGTRPEGSVLSADGRRVYVVNRESAAITLIDTASRKIVGTIAASKGPVRISRTPDDKTIIYACMHDEVVEFADAMTLKVTGRTERLPGPLVSLTISPDGKYAFTSAEERDLVYVISIADRKVIRKIQLPRDSHPDPVFALP
jgi:YVTN family beta-propeller protein